MNRLLDHPSLVFLVSLVTQWLCAWIGAWRLRGRNGLDERLRSDFNVVLSSSLTLLGLIIGFSFSMALSRYDLRKNYEEAEANAIGTEYVRVDLLGAADAAKVKSLLRSYTTERILFYEAQDPAQLPGIAARRAAMQNDLWLAVKGPASAQPTPISALIVSGMNDVLNSQGYTQAAWWNRIPAGAWALMAFISTLCNLLIGYGSRKVEARSLLLGIVPLVVAISFLLIADIDSPRGGVIRVVPQNLFALLESMPAATDAISENK
jgi:hypothetical protein